jgi:predicted site-specific integrase-resolvase
MNENKLDPKVQCFYTPSEVAAFFRVSPKTVNKWAKEGRIINIELPNGRRRYPVKEVHRLLENGDESVD